MMGKIEKLHIPSGFNELTSKQQKDLLNQCGPDGPLNKIVPNHIFGLSVSASCQIHDYTFMKSTSHEDHKKSDQIFLNNMKTEIRNGSSSKVLRFLRMGGAYIYFWAVRVYSTLKLKLKGAK